MFRVLLALFLVLGSLLHLQAQSEFTVRRVYVISDYNSRYILTYADRLIPREEMIDGETVGCFVSNLKESQLFDDIKTELAPVKGTGSFDLIVRPKYKVNPNALVVKEIDLNKSFGLDNAAFMARLAGNNVVIGMPFNPYTEIERSIAKILEEIPEKSNTKGPELWISVKIMESTNAYLYVTDRPPSCGKL